MLSLGLGMKPRAGITAQLYGSAQATEAVGRYLLAGTRRWLIETTATAEGPAFPLPRLRRRPLGPRLGRPPAASAAFAALAFGSCRCDLGSCRRRVRLSCDEFVVDSGSYVTTEVCNDRWDL